MRTYPHSPQQRLELVLQWFSTNQTETPETLREARRDLVRNPGELHAWYEVMLDQPPPDDRYFMTVQHGQ